MTKKVINAGVTANDATGDSLRAGAQAINDNFTELYNALGGSNGAPLSIVSKVLAGNGIAVSSPAGEVLVTNKPATQNEIGGIKIGTGINITEDGVASVSIYELPKASTTILGGVKVDGTTITIDSSGVITAEASGGYQLPTAGATTKGGIKVAEGSGLEITDEFLNLAPLQLPPATTETIGAVKVGSGLAVDETGLLTVTIGGSNQSLNTTDQVIFNRVTTDTLVAGSITFPDDSVQTTAYIGPDAGASLFVIVNQTGETAYSSDGTTWTQAAQFQFEGSNLGLRRIAVANQYIVYISSNENLFYASTVGTTPTPVDISNLLEGSYDWLDIQTDGTLVVAVGSYDDGVTGLVPVFAYTTDGATWTLGNTDSGYQAAMLGSRFTSVDYDGTGWLIVAGGDGDNAGAFYTTSLSNALGIGQFVNFDELGLAAIGDYDHVVWTGSNWFLRNYSGPEGGIDQKLYVSSGSNPLTSTWTEIDLTAVRDGFDFDLSDAGFYEMVGGNNKFMIASSEGQIIFTEDAGDSWTSNVPNPYTGSVDAVTSGTTTIITAITQITGGTDWSPGGDLMDRERILISDAQPTAYNGTYYLQKFGIPNELVTAVINTTNSNWVPGTYTGINIEDFTLDITVGGSNNIETITVTATGTLKFGVDDVFTVPGSALGGTTGVDDLLLKVLGFASGIEYHVYTDKALTLELDSSGFDPFVSATFTLRRGTFIDAVGFGLNKFLFGNDDEQIFTSTDLLVWTKVNDQNDDFEYWNDISFNATWGSSGGTDTGNFTFNADTITNANGMTLVTDRGTLAIGTDMEVPGVPTHFHIAFEGSNLEFASSDLFLGDDFNYVKINSGPGGVEIGTNNRFDPAQNTWEFRTDGTLTLPGAVVSATDAPIQGTFPVGAATAITVTNSPNANWTNGTGVSANGIGFGVNIDGSGNATVVVSDGGTGHFVGETFGPVVGTAFGGTSPADDMYFEVTAIDPGNRTALDLTKQTQILTAVGSAGAYSLADGAEGQIMYFVPSSGINDGIYVLVANARIMGEGPTDTTDYSWTPFSGELSAPTTIAMAIFADGAWCLRGGATD